MLLQRKVDRAMKWSRDRAMREDGMDPEEEELKAALRKQSGQDPLPSMEELRAEAMEAEKVTKGETFTMILSAMITILPVCVILVLLICLVGFLFMGGFG